MPKILFVVGMARSGSTLLTALLNRGEGIAGLGEIHLYWEFAGSERPCACGESLADCPLWGDLYRLHGEQGVDFEEMRSTFHDFVRPRPSSLLRGLTARRSGPGTGRLDRYLEATESAYRWLAERTGSEMLVDATKLPAAADLTAAMPATDVYLVHLVRDPRAVAHSLAVRRETTGREKGPAWLRYLAFTARAVLDWTLRNAYAEAKLRRLGGDRYRRLRFEDLTGAPRATVAELLAFTGGDPAAHGFATADTIELGENHIITGDSVRFKRGEVTVAPAEAWRTEMPPQGKLLATLLALPMLALYSYPLLPRHR